MSGHKREQMGGRQTVEVEHIEYFILCLLGAQTVTRTKEGEKVMRESLD